MIRKTASTINDEQLDALYNQLGRLTFVFEENVRRHGEATARVDDLLAAIGRIQDAARLHRQKLLSTGEMYAVIEAALDEPGSATTEPDKTARVFAALHRSAEQDVSRVIGLYERWVAAGPPPLGTSVSRWWDARLVELHNAILPPDDGPSVQEAAANDRRWPLQKEGE